LENSERTEFVLNNERGGTITKLLIIAAVVALVAGVFIIGYYLGRHQGKSGVSGEGLTPLPEIAAPNVPKPEEYTFYKTLTEKEDKTVSIDLRPKSVAKQGAAEKKQADDPKKESVLQTPKAKETSIRSEKKTAAQEQAKVTAVRRAPAQEKKEVPAKQASSSKLRYAVQLSSHQEKQTADLEMKKMKHQGFAAFIVATEVSGKGTWYRVRLGSFTNKAAAEKLQKEVRAKAGVSPIVVME
jgi:DedD protein